MSVQQIIGMEAAKTVADITAGGVALATLDNILPPVAVVLSIVWLSIRIFEYVRWLLKGRIGREGKD